MTTENQTPTAQSGPSDPFNLFVCFTNTDLTEGRGYQYPYAWAETRETALRLAHKKGVMGSDADVKEVDGFMVGRQVYGPVRMTPATDDDKAKEAKRDARLAVIAKARAFGMSDDEIAVLTGAKP